MALTTEIQEATQSVLEQTFLSRSHSTVPHSSGGGSGGGSSALFLQLTVDDIGVCVPLTPSYAVSLLAVAAK